MTIKVKRTNVINGQYDKRRCCWLLDRKSRRMIPSSKTSPWISSVSVWLTGTVCPSRLYEKTSGKVPRDATLDDRELHWWRTMPSATVEGSVTCPFTMILCKILCIGKRSRRSVSSSMRWQDAIAAGIKMLYYGRYLLLPLPLLNDEKSNKSTARSGGNAAVKTIASGLECCPLCSWTPRYTIGLYVCLQMIIICYYLL